MSSTWRRSDMFKNDFTFFKVFGIWAGRKSKKNYKYYSFVVILIFIVIYNINFTLSLAYTPAGIENFIREVLFYFTEIYMMNKVYMIIIMREKILEAFNLIDGKDLEGDDEISMNIIEKYSVLFMTVWKYWFSSCHIAYSTLVFVPIILHCTYNTDLVLPISQYHFLPDEVRETYFIYLYIYQSIGLYMHMVYDIGVNSFVAGLLVMAITQFKVLNTKLMNLMISDKEKKLSFDVQDKIQELRLRNFLRRYDVLLEYCDVVQEIISVSIFVVFGISSIIICVIMCGLILPATTDTFLFLVMFLAAMLFQIFILGYLGTYLNYESKELVFAAYCSEWIPRSESFKRSIRVFVERANKPIEITGLKMLPLSLSTVKSIMKTAYSFFALIRNFKE